jgi:hypothetical protein
VIGPEQIVGNAIRMTWRKAIHDPHSKEAVREEDDGSYQEKINLFYSVSAQVRYDGRKQT